MPKHRAEAYREYDIRVTPLDQEQGATAWDRLCTGSAEEQILVCREGGKDTDKKLHYHAYMKTQISESHLRTLLGQIACGKGNKFYSVRKAHDGTKGYVVKNKDPVYRHNVSQKLLEEYFEQSDAYRRNVETNRKQETRKKQSVLSRIYLEIKAHPPVHLTPEALYDAFREEYAKRDLPLPSRGTLETAIVNLLPEHLVRSYYLKNLSVY